MGGRGLAIGGIVVGGLLLVVVAALFVVFGIGRALEDQPRFHEQGSADRLAAEGQEKVRPDGWLATWWNSGPETSGRK